MATRGGAWDVLADDDEPITQGNKSAEAAATNGEGKKKRRRRRHKHAKKSNDDAGQLANPGGAVMKDLVEDCMSHGFSRAHIMKTIDVMWNAGLAYDKKEAVLAQLANKGGKGKAATQGQKQGGGKKTQAAKAATKAATKAPAPAPAPAPAKAAAQDAQAPAAGAQGEEPRSTAEMLRTVAAHPDVQQVLVALLAWRRRASRDQVSTFFTCGALDTILENVLRQPSLSTVEQELRKLLLATLDGSESVVSDILSHLRTAITTFAGLEVAATEAEYATTRDEAIGAVAAQMSAAIAAFRRSLGSGATPGASGDAERARAAAAARLSKLPAASSDIGLRFRRRDLCFDIARADAVKCSAASVMTTTAADGSDGVANPALVSKVQALSPPASEEARARQATVRKRMDELRTQYETALAPVTEEEEKLDSQIDSLQARKEQLQKELQTVTAEIKAGRARRKELNAQRDSVALRFHGEVSTLNAEQQDLLTAVNRSEAAGALEECVKDLASRLSEKAASAAAAVSRTASGQMARSRSQLFESVLAFVAAERLCMGFIRDRVFRTNQKLTALSRELQGYQAMNMSELAASIGAQVEARKQEVAEDEQLLDRFTKDASGLVDAVCAAIRAGPVTDGDKRAITQIAAYLSAMPSLASQHAKLVAAIPAASSAAPRAAGIDTSATTGRRWSTQVSLDDVDIQSRLLGFANAAAAAAANGAAPATANAPLAKRAARRGRPAAGAGARVAAAAAPVRKVNKANPWGAPATKQEVVKFEDILQQEENGGGKPAAAAADAEADGVSESKGTPAPAPAAVEAPVEAVAEADEAGSGADEDSDAAEGDAADAAEGGDDDADAADGDDAESGDDDADAADGDDAEGGDDDVAAGASASQDGSDSDDSEDSEDSDDE